MNVEIKKLSEDRLEDFLYFFDNVAFCDNPDWSSCYCYFHYITDDAEWMGRSKEKNREDAADAIRHNRLNGYLAYVDNQVAGWCNADDINNYPRIVQNEQIEVSPKLKNAAAVCFIVDVKLRKKGLARQLLEFCCDDFKLQGYEYVEAFPRLKPSNDAENYYGPLSMFKAMGFDTVKELSDFYIVRKKL